MVEAPEHTLSVCEEAEEPFLTPYGNKRSVLDVDAIKWHVDRRIHFIIHVCPAETK